MALHTENVKPAGVNKLGYKSEMAPVLMPLMGNVTASVLTTITTIRQTKLIQENSLRRVMLAKVVKKRYRLRTGGWFAHNNFLF